MLYTRRVSTQKEQIISNNLGSYNQYLDLSGAINNSYEATKLIKFNTVERFSKAVSSLLVSCNLLYFYRIAVNFIMYITLADIDMLSLAIRYRVLYKANCRFAILKYLDRGNRLLILNFSKKLSNCRSFFCCQYYGHVFSFYK